MGPRTGLVAVEKRRILPLPEMGPRFSYRSSHGLVTDLRSIVDRTRFVGLAQFLSEWILFSICCRVPVVPLLLVVTAGTLHRWLSFHFIASSDATRRFGRAMSLVSAACSWHS